MKKDEIKKVLELQYQLGYSDKAAGFKSDADKKVEMVFEAFEKLLDEKDGGDEATVTVSKKLLKDLYEDGYCHGHMDGDEGYGYDDNICISAWLNCWLKDNKGDNKNG